MKELSRDECNELGMSEVMRRMKEEWKESVGFQDASGKVTMVLSYQPPAEACVCAPSDRDWWCSCCGGFSKGSPRQSDGPEKGNGT